MGKNTHIANQDEESKGGYFDNGHL